MEHEHFAVLNRNASNTDRINRQIGTTNMKTYTMSFADAISHKPEHPERTAKKSGTGMNFDITFRVWPNRESMLKTIQIQRRARNYRTGDWKAVIE